VLGLVAAACEGTPVLPGPRVVVIPPWAAVLPGDTVRLRATIVDPEGDTLIPPSVQWTSSAGSIATVDPMGLVTGGVVGTATITVQADTLTGAADVAVQPAVLVGAGDIASCSSSGDEATATLLDTIPGIVFTAGDNAYPNGATGDYAGCYGPSWGRHKPRTRPAPGNHEYQTAGAAAYFAYFGVTAGAPAKGYYSFDHGTWHVIALNSNIPMSAGSPQEQWLRADLAASTKPCAIAYWHHPRFSSGTQHGSHAETQPLWQALYDANAEIVVSGHEHNYERFAPQAPDGTTDPARGLREFVVGTGGASHYPFGTPLPNSEVRDNTTFGVLKLTLQATGYDWTFIAAAGGTFTDSGSGTCH
jgi:Big-like domain-containing protein/calcineurin-like phosphoesterase family protein